VVQAMRAIAKTHGLAIVGEGGLITVGAGAADARQAKAPAPPKHVLAGSFVSLRRGVLTLEVDGTRVALDLSSDPSRRKLQTAALRGATRGERLLVTFAEPAPPEKGEPPRRPKSGSRCTPT